MGRFPIAIPVPQLDGSKHQKVNCGPATASLGIAHASYNRIVPEPEIMRRMGLMGDGPTDFGDLKRGVAAYADDFAELGLQAPELRKLGYITADALVRSLVGEPQTLHVLAIKYAPVLHTPYASDDDFTGGHFVAGIRLYVPRGPIFHRVRRHELAETTPDGVQTFGLTAEKLLRIGWVLVTDPIADGRRPKIPQAPQLWPLGVLFTAGDAFYDAAPLDGRLPVATIKRSEAA